jgi:hypothetical protein
MNDNMLLVCMIVCNVEVINKLVSHNMILHQDTKNCKRPKVHVIIFKGDYIL